MSQAFYRKWRPHLWEDVIGQEHVVQTLRNAVAADRFAHAYLFAGPRGTGKTTTARLLAKALNCLEEAAGNRPCDQCENCQAVNQGRFLDLIEIDAASNTSVEDVRDLRDKINFSPNVGRYKVYIVDEVHMLSTAAFNALLKTLEEPPSHAVFILATTEVHKIPATVVSRCQRHEFRRIPMPDITALLKRIAEEENISVELAVLSLVARQATGAMRDAISLLDQLASTGKAVTLEMAQMVLGTATSQAVLDLVDALEGREPAKGLAVLQDTLDRGSDPRQMARQVVEYLRNLLLIRLNTGDQIEVTPEVRQHMNRHAQAFSVADLLHFIQMFNQAASESRGNWLPGLPLEMAFVEALQPPQVAADKDDLPPPAAPKAASPARSAASAGRSAPAASEVPARQAGAQVKGAAVVVADEEPMDPHSARLLDENWRNILTLTRQQNPNTYGLLNSCKSRHLKDDVLTLGFASDVLKFQMEKSSNVEVVLGVLRQVFSQEIGLRCIALSGKHSTPPPGVDSDGMVASALRDLGGEIVDVH